MSSRLRGDWQLLVRVAPLVALAVLAKLAADLLGWDTVDLNPLYSGLVAATVFLIGFLLAGTTTRSPLQSRPMRGSSSPGRRIRPLPRADLSLLWPATCHEQ
jgi:hypothetical protein